MYIPCDLLTRCAIEGKILTILNFCQQYIRLYEPARGRWAEREGGARHVPTNAVLSVSRT